MRITAAIVAIIGLWALGVRADAQETTGLTDPPALERAWAEHDAVADTRADPGPIRQSLARLEKSAPIPAVAGAAKTLRQPPSLGRRILGGVAAGAAGMVLGAIAGAYVAPGCPHGYCDDPGLEGATYGSLLGLVGGAALGASVGW